MRRAPPGRRGTCARPRARPWPPTRLVCCAACARSTPTRGARTRRSPAGCSCRCLRGRSRRSLLPRGEAMRTEIPILARLSLVTGHRRCGQRGRPGQMPRRCHLLPVTRARAGQRRRPQGAHPPPAPAPAAAARARRRAQRTRPRRGLRRRAWACWTRRCSRRRMCPSWPACAQQRRPRTQPRTQLPLMRRRQRRWRRRAATRRRAAASAGAPRCVATTGSSSRRAQRAARRACPLRHERHRVAIL